MEVELLGPDIIVAVGPEVPHLVPHQGCLPPHLWGEAGGAGHHVEQAGAVCSANGQGLGLQELSAEEKTELIHSVDGDGCVGLGGVVGDSFEAQLHPLTSWWRWAVARIKPQLLSLAVHEEHVCLSDLHEVGLEGLSDVWPQKFGQVQVEDITNQMSSVPFREPIMRETGAHSLGDQSCCCLYYGQILWRN